MGIPHYFKHVTHELNGIISTTNPLRNCERLFLDFNCAIHKCANELKADLTFSDFETHLIEKCSNFISCMYRFIRPTELVYVSIDGVVPMAKIAQQRKRRYFSDWKKNNLQKCTNPVAGQYLENEWNSNQITPGTQFMRSLIKHLETYCAHFEKKNGIRVIVDYGPGEGEHKICHFIRSTPVTVGDIIYGLDADMILLGMLSKNVEHTVLLREDTKTPETYIFMKLNDTKTQIYKQFSDHIGDSRADPKLLIKCYVFLTFFLGNDFLPNLTYIHLRDNGLQLLLDAYRTCFDFFQNQYHILCPETNEINFSFLTYFLDLLQRNEDSLFCQQIIKYYDSTAPIKKKKQSSNCRELIAHESDRLDRYPLFHKFPKGLIDLHNSGWRVQYYYHLFDKQNSSAILKSTCTEYVKGLVWIVNYYFKQLTEWSWFYPFDFSPTILDLYNHIQVTTPFVFEDDNSSDIISECEQLIMVIPPSSCDACLKGHPELQKLMTSPSSPCLDIFPIHFEINTFAKCFLHECGGVGLNLKKRIRLP
jgi:5'-3' exonuclease